MKITEILAGFLPGYKTYVAAGGLAVAALLHYRAGDLAGALSLLSQALAVAGLRAAIPAPAPAQPDQPQQPAPPV